MTHPNIPLIGGTQGIGGGGTSGQDSLIVHGGNICTSMDCTMNHAKQAGHYPTTQPTNSIDSELEELGKLFANRIGSPWGEGATYSHSQAEPEDENDKPQENGRLYSHLDDSDFELFVKDFVQAIKALYRKEIEEATRTTLRQYITGEDAPIIIDEIAAKLLPPTKGEK